MTRVEENKETIRIIHNEEIDLDDTAAINARMIVLLADISKSLAIQADAAVEANKIVKGMDEVPTLVIPDNPKITELFKGRQRGHWIEMASPTGSIWECSECGDDVSEQDTFIFSFCPYCGADMREVEE